MVRGLIGPVQPFHNLFEWAVFFENSIVVGKSKHLGNPEGKVFSKLFCEFHDGQRISAAAGSDELKVFRKLCEPLGRMRMARIQGPTPRLSDTG